MDLVASVRLSKDSDGTNSPGAQREDIIDFAEDHGHTIVAWAEDIDVSGGIPIEERPDLGKWFDVEHIDRWQGLIGSRLDRLFRSQLDYLLFARDKCMRQGKVIIDVSDGTDTSTKAGRDRLNDRARDAEREREKISDRRSRAARRIRSEARWGGGVVPFGYRAVPHYPNGPEDKPKGYDLVPDEITAPVVRVIAKWAINGETATTIARWLNAIGLPTSQSGFRLRNGHTRQAQWRQTSVLAILRNPVLRGAVTQVMDAQPAMSDNRRGTRIPARIIRARDGSEVTRPGVLDENTWTQLQAALDMLSQHRSGNRHDAHPLLGVAFCLSCGGPLYALRQGANPRWSYYVCRNRQQGTCKARGIPMARLDADVIDLMTGEINGKPSPFTKIEYQEKIAVYGVSRKNELDTIGRQIADLDEALRDGDLAAKAYGRMTTQLEEKRAELVAEERPGGYINEKTGQAIAKRFLDGTPDGRRALLIFLGIKVHALIRTVDGKSEVVSELEAAADPDTGTTRVIRRLSR